MIASTLSALALATLAALAPPAPSVGGGLPEIPAPTMEALRAHYARAEAELRAADVSHLDAETGAARARALDALARYRERGRFGRHLAEPGARIPTFVDAGGRRCAVAELLHASGEDELVARIAGERNHAWVVELASDAGLAAWLERVGLRVEEAARIQAPAVISDDMIFDDPMPLVPPGSTRFQPGLALPVAPGTGAASDRAPSPAGGAPPIPRRTGGRSRSAPATGTSVAAAAPDWWMWWELNKLDFLEPNPVRFFEGVATPGGPEVGGEVAAATRARLLVTLAPRLRDDDATVRAAAALAVGRLAGAKATELLAPLRDDPQERVRLAALLGLGVSGDMGAASALVSIARNRESEEDRRELSWSALERAFATIALGLGRRHGFGPEVDAVAARIVELEDATSEELLGLLCYQVLAPNERLKALALEVATDRDAGPAERSRAVEALRGYGDAETVARLTDLLSGRRLDLRRSAALALGDCESPFALPALLTAYELERELLTRSFLLISIGRHGGEEARATLAGALEREGELRPFAALGLGILARADDDAEAREILRERAGEHASAEAFDATVLALGIARDESSVPMLREVAATGGRARERQFAYLALGMIGTPEAREAILAGADGERSWVARIGVAQGLGLIGDPRDLERMVGMLEETVDPEVKALVAASLAFHGSGRAIELLEDVVERPRSSPAARAAAIEAIGLLAEDGPRLLVGDVARQSNHVVAPGWLAELWRYTL